MRDKCVEMRDRLIEMLRKRSCFYAKCINRCGECDCIPINDDYIGNLADYLLANGAIVPLCKVGDTVYSYNIDFGVILPYFVENLTIAYLEENEFCYTYEANCTNENELIDSIDFDCEDIGKTVFLSEEEAERALKECEPICDYTKTNWNDCCECSAKDYCDKYNERSEIIGDLLGEVIGEIKNEGR